MKKALLWFAIAGLVAILAGFLVGRFERKSVKEPATANSIARPLIIERMANEIPATPRVRAGRPSVTAEQP